MIIASRMTRNPVTATPDMSIPEASELMKREKVHRLPVLDKNKKLVGVITEKDVLYASPSPATSLSIHEMAYLLSKLRVKDLMARDVVTITEDVTVEEAARMMVDNDFSCLPVVRGDVLVGIVSKSDMFRMLLELFGARKYGVRVSMLVEDKPGMFAQITSTLAKEGLDIVSFGTFTGTDPTNIICTIKVQGCSKDHLLELLNPMVIEVLDIRET